MTTTLDVATPGLLFGETQEEKLQIGTTDHIYNSGLLVNGTQHCDQQEALTRCPYLVQVRYHTYTSLTVSPCRHLLHR